MSTQLKVNSIPAWMGRGNSNLIQGSRPDSDLIKILFEYPVHMKIE